MKNNEDRKDGVKVTKGAASIAADETRSNDITETNQEIDRLHGDEVEEGGTATRLEQISEGSVDEHMPANSESPEDKANDVIQSGIIWS